MKKLLHFAVVAILVFPFITDAALPDGCKAEYKFSVTTGIPCVDIQNASEKDMVNIHNEKIKDFQKQLVALEEEYISKMKSIRSMKGTQRKMTQTLFTSDFTANKATLEKLINEENINYQKKVSQYPVIKDSLICKKDVSISPSSQTYNPLVTITGKSNCKIESATANIEVIVGGKTFLSKKIKLDKYKPSEEGYEMYTDVPIDLGKLRSSNNNYIITASYDGVAETTTVYY